MLLRTRSRQLSPGVVTAVLVGTCLLAPMAGQGGPAATRKTVVTIVGDEFHINGAPTYQGRVWRTSGGQEHRVQGLLMNSRMVQGTFDDLNPATRGQWAYPDTGAWDANRNTTEFLQAMAEWRAHGLLSFTLNLQGGCPVRVLPVPTLGELGVRAGRRSSSRVHGASRAHSGPGRRTRHGSDGGVLLLRTGRTLVRRSGRRARGGQCDEVDPRTRVQERAHRGEQRVQHLYDHAILRCDRVHELIERVRRTEQAGRRLYASTSLGGNSVPPAAVVAASDYVLLHGNGVARPDRLGEMIAEVRRLPGYTPKPIVNNEDDQPWRVAAQGWREDGNNFVEAVRHYASWGFFDFRLEPENQDFNAGYQSVPVNWHLSAPRKQQFFDLLATITGSPGTPKLTIGWAGDVGAFDLKGDRDLEASRRPRVEILLNNEVVARASEMPFRGKIARVPAGPHGVKARLTYDAGGHDVVVETPLYRNPWWPYGGPARQ